MRRTIAILSLLISSSGVFAADDTGVEFFEKRIRPLLVKHCYECHSSKAEEIEGKLRLDTRDDLRRGGETGPAITPGNPDKSLLIEAVRYGNADLQMPPDNKLPAEDIAALETWIRMGAPDPREGVPTAVATTAPTTPTDDAAKHFIPPTDHNPPTVKNGTWPRNSIDRFILAKLEDKGLAPAPEADRRTLIRRAYFDLLGLPPPAAEVESFANDTSPDAYAKLIDRLLASPLYGQRWARHWLDVVRYTDSYDSRITGNEFDVAFAWRYRDWVVDSFNKDLPYDQFVRLQIAGDLLPPPAGQRLNKDGIVATGVYVLGEWGGGDSDKDKLITDIVDDQVDLTTRAFMGLTVSCARCHDHKFDPISTKDYYGLAGIFFSTHIIPDPGPKTGGPLNLRVPLLDDLELAQRKADTDRVAELDKEIDSALDAQYAALAAEMLPAIDKYLVAAWESQHPAAGAQGASSLDQIAHERGLHPYALRRWVSYNSTPQLMLFPKLQTDLNGFKGIHALRNADAADTPVAVVNTTTAPVETLPGLIFPPRSVSIHPSPSAGVAVSWRSPITGRISVTGRITDGHAACGDGVTWSLSRVGGPAAGELASGTLANGGNQPLSEGTGGASLSSIDIRAGDTIQLAVLPKVEYSCDTTNIDLQITEQGGATRTWDLAKDVASSPSLVNPSPDSHGNKDIWQFHDVAGQSDAAFAAGSPIARFNSSISPTSDSSQVLAAATDVARSLREAQTEMAQARAQGRDTSSIATPAALLLRTLTDPKGPFWSPARADDANLSPATRDAISSKRTERRKLADALAEPIPVTQAMQEGGTPKSMFAAIQDVPVHIRGRYDRLGDTVPRGFPRVIAGPHSPPIPKDTSGRLQLANWLTDPAHPLTARVIVNRIWQHHFGTGIVPTSNNFGKLGTPPTHPELLDHLAVTFVKNGWSLKSLHRAIMLSATYTQSSIPTPEAMRLDPDNRVLSRMTRRKLEAEALRDALLSAAGVLDTTRNGRAVNDLATPRRSLYLLTVRSDRTTYRTLFDAADPAAIVEKRTDSTVAPQALFMMNHPFVLAQAKNLAARATRDGGADTDSRVHWLYQTLFSRSASTEELSVARVILGGDGKENRWQAYCHLLVCTNEFMYVD